MFLSLWSAFGVYKIEERQRATLLSGKHYRKVKQQESRCYHTLIPRHILDETQALDRWKERNLRDELYYKVILRSDGLYHAAVFKQPDF